MIQLWYQNQWLQNGSAPSVQTLPKNGGYVVYPINAAATTMQVYVDEKGFYLKGSYIYMNG